LTWDRLESKLWDALKHPHQSVPVQISCPAVRDLHSQIVSNITKSALQKKGEGLSADEVFNCDQRLVILRILEAVISAGEDWLAGNPGSQFFNVETAQGNIPVPVSPLWKQVQESRVTREKPADDSSLKKKDQNK
jgi:hypothetical protein